MPKAPSTMCARLAISLIGVLVVISLVGCAAATSAGPASVTMRPTLQ